MVGDHMGILGAVVVLFLFFSVSVPRCQSHTHSVSHHSNQMEPSSAKSVAETMHGHKFIIEMARCSLAFGAPSHRLEAQLSTAANVLDIHAEFLLLPNVVFISFFDAEQGAHSSGLHVIKRIGGISL